MEVGRIVADGDTVVLEHRIQAVLPGGRDYDNDYCMLFTVRDGLVHRVREHLDTHRGLLAFGLLAEPGRVNTGAAVAAGDRVR